MRARAPTPRDRHRAVIVEPTLELELELVTAGADLVIGCDEVGRGAIAGPVAVGVFAILPRDGGMPVGLRDSKLLSERRREAILPAVQQWGVARSVGLASAQEIDRIGIVAALALAAHRALVEIAPRIAAAQAPVVLLDGAHDWLAPVLRERPLPGIRRVGVTTRVKADRDCGSVAGASVLAKVHRDRLMIEADARTPGYGWAGNKGYGAAAHFAAIAELGATDLHRRTWLRSESTVADSATAEAV